MLREALSNAARHAKATRVEVALEAIAAELRISVTDNGVGIAADRERSSGLANLAARAAELGGDFGVGVRGVRDGSGDGPGTTLLWRAPYPLNAGS